MFSKQKTLKEDRQRSKKFFKEERHTGERPFSAHFVTSDLDKKDPGRKLH